MQVFSWTKRANRLLPARAIAAVVVAGCLVAPAMAAAEPTIQTSTTLTCGTRPALPGEEVRCLVRVRSSGAGATAATGLVKFTAVGGKVTASCTLVALIGPESACPSTYVLKEGGVQTISAGYVGDQTHLPSSGQATVAVSTTATRLTCRPESFAAGGSTVCTAEVRNTGAAVGTPSGTVRFGSSIEGQPEPSSCTLNENGACSVTFSSQAIGIHAITATYDGDATHPGSRGEATVAARGATETTTDCGPEIRFRGDQIRCLVRVRSSGAGATAATGLVTVTAGGKGLASCILVPTIGPPPDSTTQCTYTANDPVLQNVVATYAGDKIHLPSSGRETVVVSHTVTSLTCQPESVAVGEASSCTAEVKNAGAASNSLSGTLSIESDHDGRFEPNSCKVDENNVCTVKYFPEIGTREAGEKHLITATYSGDATHPRSSAEAALAVRGTSVKLACSQQTEALGDTAICVARVVNEGIGSRSLTGTVRFESSREGRFSSAVCTLVPFINGDGAFCSTSYTPEVRGAHVIHAFYSGDSTHPPAIDGKSQVNALVRPTTTTFDCAGSPPVHGSTPCVAHVRDSSASLGSAPTGAVVFSSPEQKEVFTECVLTPVSFVESVCTTVYTPKISGTTLLVAQYGGDKVHGPSETSQRLIHVTATEVDCGDSTSVGVPNVCTVTVRDLLSGGATPPAEGGPTPPGGLVELSSPGPGTFSRTSCTLEPIGPDASTCSGAPVTYRPQADGGHVISAFYRSDPTHEPSFGSKDLEVRSKVSG
jgi:large repetitive protein